MKRLEPHVLRLLELTAAIVIPLPFCFLSVFMFCVRMESMIPIRSIMRRWRNSGRSFLPRKSSRM